MRQKRPRQRPPVNHDWPPRKKIGYVNKQRAAWVAKLLDAGQELDGIIIQSKAANNRHGGRPRKIDDAAVARAKELKDKGISASDIGKMLGVSRATVYRYLI